MTTSSASTKGANTTGSLRHKTLTTVKKSSHGKQYSLHFNVPKLTTLYLVYEGDPRESAAGRPKK